MKFRAPYDWPPAAVTILRRMIADRCSSTQIIQAIHDELGVWLTRNSVIGKANRLGLRTNGGSSRPPGRRGKVAVVYGNLQYRNNEAPPAKDFKIRQAQRIEADGDAPANAIPFPRHSRKQCAYIFGDPRAGLPRCCGAPVASDHFEFCAEHMKSIMNPNWRPLDVDRIAA